MKDAFEHHSFAEFAQRLDVAIRDVDQLAVVDTDPMIGTIQRQLRFVKQWTQGGTRPAQHDFDKLSFGHMANRAVRDTDARLANELYELSSFLIFWPSTQPSGHERRDHELSVTSRFERSR